MSRYAVFVDVTQISPGFDSAKEAEEYVTSIVDFNSDKEVKIEIGDKVVFVMPYNLVVKPI